MNSRSIFILLVTAAVLVIAALFLLSGTDAEIFAEGNAVLPAPFGDLIALRQGEGQWVVYDAARTRLGAFHALDTPCWIPDEAGNRLVYRDEKGIWLIGFRERIGPDLLLEEIDAYPLQTLSDGRILVVRKGAQGYETFSFCCWDGSAGESKETEPIPLSSGACAQIKASANGKRIAYAIPGEETGFRIKILEAETGGDAYQEVLEIKDAQLPEFYWSSRGENLVFASLGGGVELHDFTTQERRWLRHNTYNPLMGCPFKVVFSPKDARMIITTCDDYGYRQITILELATGTESRFTHGWADHYGLETSRDFRFYTYRQSSSKVPDRMEAGGDLEEAIYAVDCQESKGTHIHDRPLTYDCSLAGPVLSGDARFIYFVVEGKALRYPMNP